MSSSNIYIDLEKKFNELNELHFDGFLRPPSLGWNARLKVCAGRFIPRRRQFLKKGFFSLDPVDPSLARIEIAHYLLSEPDGEALIVDTLGHEMIHYWLWVRGLPYGHTPEFTKKMKLMGVSRYNQVPKRRAYQYLYRCIHCQKDYPTRKWMKKHYACALCCKLHGIGTYDARFKLIYIGEMKDILSEAVV